MVTYNRDDLDFILRQIEIAEQHAAGADLTDLIYSPLLPWGLRTVDGTYNNIIEGREGYGSADLPFPELSYLSYPEGTAPDTPFTLGPGAPALTNTDYNLPSSVVDTAPRTISNLIADQTLKNPAAILAALKFSGIEGADATVALATIQAAYAAASDTDVAMQQAQAKVDLALSQLAIARAAQGSAAVIHPFHQTTANAYTDAISQIETAKATLIEAMQRLAALSTDLGVTGTTITAAHAAELGAIEGLASQVRLAAIGARNALNPPGTDFVIPADLADAQSLITTTGQLFTAARSLNSNNPEGTITAVGDVTRFNNTVALMDPVSTELSGLGSQLAVSNTVIQANLTESSAAVEAVTLAEAALADAQAELANPTAVATETLNGIVADYGIEMTANGSLVIPNVAPDEGISAPFNSWMTLFGQFFDHGLDLVAKTSTSKVYIPLLPDDPLYVEGGNSNFMVVTRTTPDAPNLTTPLVDQNQTYTSHASHQVFLREYSGVAGAAVSTGHLLEGSAGGLATWADIKAQSVSMLGITLDDRHIHEVPMVVADAYGEFVRSPTGYAMVAVSVTLSDGTTVNAHASGKAGGLNLFNITATDLVGFSAPVGTTVSAISAYGTGHAFLDDIAHTAAPAFVDLDRNPATTDDQIWTTADADDQPGDGFNDQVVNGLGVRTTYDNELLDRHFITGDGRGNENIGLTTVHHIFHSEHNRMVEHTKDVVLASGDIAFINEWLAVDITAIPADLSTLVWDGERLFQAARFGTEMQYQHLVFEEFARKVNPMVDLFVFNPTMDINPAIVAEFAHTVYRFGHSMLNETVDRLGADGATSDDIGLIEAFLNPVAFNELNGETVSADVAAGAIVRGMTRQRGNEIDEFVTDALRNNLLGLPLDLAAINLARGREAGVPTLQEARASFYEEARSEWLKPYTSWVDFAQHLKNPASIVNFIAAYGNHETILSATTLEEKRAAATLLVLGGVGEPTDRLAFLNGTSGHEGLGGLNDVDFWIGGLAESILPFGGMLGSSFTFVFEKQLEMLQNGDRFYYLSRTQGLHFLQELENNALSKIIMLNTDLGEDGATHLPGEIFSNPDYILEIADLGDDTIWGDAGDDYIEGGHGINRLHGGTGDDIIYGGGDAEFIHGEEGNDVINAGNGLGDLVFAGSGQDFVIGGIDSKEVFGAEGNDFILGSPAVDFLLGGEGDDWMEGGEGFDTIAGDNSQLFFNSTIIGHDVMFSGTNENDFDAESGDDIMIQGESVIRNEGMLGFDWVSFEEHTAFGADADMRIKIFTTVEQDILRTRFDRVEAMSGSAHNDVLIGDDRVEGVIDPLEPEALVAENIFAGDELTREGVERISGFADVLAPVIGDLSQYAATQTVFNAGNVLLGGDGSDIIQGGGGNDIIDGDKWLNVRISIVDENGVEIGTTEKMQGLVTMHDSASPLNGRPLDELMFNRDLNPGQLRIVREILNSNDDPNGTAVNGNVGDIDTAVFQGALSEYTIRDGQGNVLDLSQPLAADIAGTITVEHTLGAANGGGIFDDGTDTLTGMERLQFADRTIELVAGLNESPVGAPTLQALQSSAGRLLFQAGLPIRVATNPDGSLAGVTDLDNPNGGAITDFTVTWQIEDRPGSGTFIDALASGVIFTPSGDPLVGIDGERIRAIVSYTDANGVREAVATSPSPPLTPATNLIGTPAADTVAGTDRIPNIPANLGFGVALPINGNDGTLAQPIDGGGGDDSIFGLGGNDVLAGGAGNDLVDGGENNDTLFGNAGDDELLGGAGTDTLDGGDGDDLLDGGAGNDRLIGGAGSNIFDGGAGNGDTAVLSGLRGDYTFVATPTGTLEAVNGTIEEELIDVEVIEFSDGETITIAQAQNDAGAIRVPVGQTTFSGTPAPDFIIGRNVDEAIFGGTGADVILGQGGADTLNGGGGADALVGGAGADRLNGGGGADFLSGGDDADRLNGNGGADTLLGDAGDDIVNGGNGDDLIIWNVGDGRDLIDGGDHATIGDTFEINGTGLGETYRFYAITAPIAAAAAAGLGPFAITTEIVVTFNDGSGEAVIAELDNVEEIVINTDALATSVAGLSNIRGDNVEVIGDFTTTSLNVQTITINGSDGDDVIDISKLQSEHRIVFKSNGGDDKLIGTLRPQDVIELPEGAGTSTETENENGTKTITFSTGSVTFNATTSPVVSGGTPDGSHDLTFTAHDVAELLNLVRGLPSSVLEEAGATGIRDLEGTGNNIANPNWGSADQSFIRLTEARYGDYDPVTGNRAINPIFDGLDPRTISNILGTQEADLAKNDAGANIFFMAFGQYFDHGLDFLPKGGHGTLSIGGGADNPVDLTRGSIANISDVANGATPEHINKTSPFVDQNQAYGSTELVGQFLREGDDNGGLGAKLLSGGPDPSNSEFNLLPTLREAILHHWQNNTLFTSEKLAAQGYANGEVHFQDYYTVEGTPLVDENGNINEMIAHGLNQNFMGSGHTLVGDANNFIDILDHYVAGDLRANENYTLTSIHTIWARNHNYHVEKLADAGFAGTAEELYQAAKIVNETEYQKVVFNEFADYLLGGLKGSGHHGHDEYNPNVDARISHEFAAAVYRVGHSLIGETITVLDANGNPTNVPLFDAFLNPTNDAETFRVDMDHNPTTTNDVVAGQDAVNFLGQAPYNYLPQPGYEQLGVNSIIGGIVGQPAEEVDFNLVDAVRNDLVRIRADLFAFNVARGWDVGLGTLNQIRADLLQSTDPYIQEAIELSQEDLTPYSSWEDFQQRNGLSDSVIAQFKQAYPDLVLDSQEKIDAFTAVNPNITLVGGNTVKGIDRVDLWVGGLAEEHINGGMVGTTFWVVLHEQFDRLQEGDRYYYLDRAEGFDFYDISEEQSFADIVARNTGIQGLDSDIFGAEPLNQDDNADNGTETVTDDGVNTGEDDETVADNDTGEDDTGEDETADGGSDTDTGGDTATGGTDDGSTSNTATPVIAQGDEGENALFGSAAGDMLDGGLGDDTIIALGGDDTAVGCSGDDIVYTDSGNDLLFGNSGNDTLSAGAGDDTVFGGSGRDRISGGDGNDILDGGTDQDVIDGGAGDDLFIANFGDGNDVYHGGTGFDTLDMEAITANITANLGWGGTVTSSESGSDTIDSIENFKGGSGHDSIIASSAVNVMSGGAGNDTFVFETAANANGDEIIGFTAGDKIDLSGIAGSLGAGQDFTLTNSFTAAGQLQFRVEGSDTYLEGTLDNDNDADFSIKIAGRTDLNEQDLV